MSPVRRPHAIRLVAALAVVGVAVAAAPASAAAPSVRDIDAELVGSKLHLSTETAGATKVTFRFAGRSAVGRLAEIDREDGTRDFERIVNAGGVKVGRRAITVRACGADGCTTKTSNVRIERDDD